MKEVLMLAEALLGADWANRQVPGQILAIDDDPGNLEVLVGLLEDNYCIQATTSPAQALKLLDAYEFDLVLADQRMPEMTGIQLLNIVRQRSPETVRIIVSAYSDSRELLSSINEGQVFRYVLKPWVPEELEGVVKQALEHRLQRITIRRLVDVLRNRNDDLLKALSELKDAQEHLVHSARLATVGQLTTSIAHELRNQLTVIRAVYEMVRGDELTEELREMVAVGDLAINNLVSKLGTVGEFTREKQWEIDRRPVDLRRVVNDCLIMTRMDVRAKQRCLRLNQPDYECPAPVDHLRISQVIVNLLRNAMDATSAGGLVEVTLSDHGGFWQIAVQDDGVGIAESDMVRLFDMFFTTKDSGVGLGLAISKQIIDAHGGIITADSKIGHGAKFMVQLQKGQ